MSTAHSTVTESNKVTPLFHNVHTLFTGMIQDAKLISIHPGESYYEAYIEMLSGTTEHPIKTMMTAIIKGKQAALMMAEYVKDPNRIPLTGHFKVSNMTTHYIQGENGTAEPVLVGTLLSLVFQDNVMQNKYCIAAPALIIPTLHVKNEVQVKSEAQVKDEPFARNTNLVKRTPSATLSKGIHETDNIVIRGICHIPTLIVGSLFLYLLF